MKKLLLLIALSASVLHGMEEKKTMNHPIELNIALNGTNLIENEHNKKFAFMHIWQGNNVKQMFSLYNNTFRYLPFEQLEEMKEGNSLAVTVDNTAYSLKAQQYAFDTAHTEKERSFEQALQEIKYRDAIKNSFTQKEKTNINKMQYK
ncbi:MAG: hypothetical protein AB7R69_06670 [Candidatus Babeliales bacterium]